MKTSFGLAALAICPVAMGAQSQPDPATLGYQWSLSGKQYATTTRAISKNVLIDGLDFAGVAGVELTTGVPPSIGLGLTYHLGGQETDLDLGVFILVPQKGRADVAIGFQLRF